MSNGTRRAVGKARTGLGLTSGPGGRVRDLVAGVVR